MKRKGKPTLHCSKHDNQNLRETHHRKPTNSRTFTGKFKKLIKDILKKNRKYERDNAYRERETARTDRGGKCNPKACWERILRVTKERNRKKRHREGFDCLKQRGMAESERRKEKRLYEYKRSRVSILVLGFSYVNI